MYETNFEEFASKALQSLGINLDEELLSDTTDLLLKVESFKQCLEKRKAEQKSTAKSNKANGNATDFSKIDQVPEKSTVADDTALSDPNRTSILLTMNKPAAAGSTASIFDNENEHGRDKQTGKINNVSAGSAKDVDMSDDSKRSSHRNRSRATKSGRSGDNEHSRRRSADRHRRKRSDEKRKKSSTRPTKTSRHRSRSPHSSKYSTSKERDRDRDRDRRSVSRSRRLSHERHDSKERGSKRSRKRVERFDRNDRQSSFTPPKIYPRRSTSRNRSLASPIESRRRSLSPGRPYKQNLSPPPSWHRYERRQVSLSPLPRGPRTPPNTPPPSENDPFLPNYVESVNRENAAHFGRNGYGHGYGGHRSPPKFKYDSNNVILMPAASLYHQSPNILPPSSSTDADYTGGYNRIDHSPQYAQNHFSLHSVPIHPSPLNHSHAPVLGSGDGFYYQTSFPPNAMISLEQPHAIQSQQRCFGPFANQPPYGNSPINSMQIKRTLMRKPERKSTIVQKGNVLEIVPGLELQQDAANESDAEPLPKTETPAMSDEQILQMEKLKRKKDRQQKRLAKEKRKEFVINEIKRLGQQFIVGANGKMIKAVELLKASSFGMNGSPKSDINRNDSNESAKSPQPLQLYDYDVNAKAGKSIIINGDLSNRFVSIHFSSISNPIFCVLTDK